MKKVLDNIKPGVSQLELEELAASQIQKSGAAPSFKTVPGYNWATCITVNDEVVHGIPKDYKLQEGDIVGIDLGVFWQGFHTDAAWTIQVGNKKDPRKEKFLQVGEKALNKAIGQAQVGNRVGNISASIQDTVEEAGFSVVRALVGHGVGRRLHEEPEVPGFITDNPSPTLKEGMTLAIEVIYAMGSPEVAKSDDNWTIVTRDGSLAGLFEATVAITESGPIVLTAMK